MIAAAVLLLAPGLYEQAVARMLAERFPDAEYLLIEGATGRAVAGNRIKPSEAIPTGSLVKPLLAASAPRDRKVTCSPGQCWLPRGHGRIGVVDAIAFSCNRWFGIRGGEARMSASEIARGYIEVSHVPQVREGMKKAVTAGTAQRLGVEALAKTGTAPCVHSARGPGDGLVVAVWPQQAPKYVLLVRVHGTTGANAAATAGSLLRVVRDGR